VYCDRFVGWVVVAGLSLGLLDLGVLAGVVFGEFGCNWLCARMI